MTLAWALPRRIAYWAFIRVAAHGTTGPYGSTVPYELDIMEALTRWDNRWDLEETEHDTEARHPG